MIDGTLGSLLREAYFSGGLKSFSQEWRPIETPTLCLYKGPANNIAKKMKNALRDNLKNQQTAKPS